MAELFLRVPVSESGNFDVRLCVLPLRSRRDAQGINRPRECVRGWGAFTALREKEGAYRGSGGILGCIQCTFRSEICSLACDKLSPKIRGEAGHRSVVPFHVISPFPVSCPYVRLWFADTAPNVGGSMSNFIISFSFISICTLGKKILLLHSGCDSERSGVGCVMEKDISQQKDFVCALGRQLPYEL